jgi:hypothetical protein
MQRWGLCNDLWRNGDVGGVPDAQINTEHEITRIDDDIFTITVTTAATSTVASGGGTSIDIECQINPGLAITTAGYGWGTGGWSIRLLGFVIEHTHLPTSERLVF